MGGRHWGRGFNHKSTVAEALYVSILATLAICPRSTDGLLKAGFFQGFAGFRESRPRGHPSDTERVSLSVSAWDGFEHSGLACYSLEAR